ncbi:MAG TPA: hypothetical protein VFS20_11920 [Longimicrobium sp.]|nr:hypothetical protein [Longimicrobium sp.]
MTTRLDRVLRWVWLIIGVLLLILILSSLVFVASEAIGARGGSSAADSTSSSVDADSGKADSPLRYDPPEAIRGSAARIVMIRRGSGYTYRSTASSAPSSGEAPAVNVAFLEGDGARLLLGQPAYIRRVAFPGSPRVAPGDTLRWIVYEMALEDSNGNGRMDESDQRSLYVSDLQGRGLRRVLPPGYELRDWAPQPGGSLIVTGVQLARDAGAMVQRAFVVDAAGAVRPHAALDSVIGAAARIGAKP